MPFIAGAIIATAFTAAGVVLVLTDHPWFGALMLFAACSVTVRDKWMS